jgi:predicted phosphodiesterase
MQFCLISDVHIDHTEWNWRCMSDIPKSVPVVVAGDISNDVWEACYWLVELKKRYSTVIWVAGNHDAYNLGYHKTQILSKKWPHPRDVAEIYDHYARWSKANDIHFLNRSSIKINGVSFLGATGWHDFRAPGPSEFLQKSAWNHYMSDREFIKWAVESSDPTDPIVEAATRDADWIKNAVCATTEPKVVITHHIPHNGLLKFTTDLLWNQLNGSFHNSMLETCADSSVAAWCYGHTHFRGEHVINGIRYINNACGYPGENPGWSPTLVDLD